MYHYLTGALKRKIILELKNCFRYYFPQHEDIVDYINHKYSFKQRPQKGIVVTNSSANPVRLSADNFQGTVKSHVMFAHVGTHSGLALEWVKEDNLLLHRTGGPFPSAPGIYYIEMASRSTLESQVSPTEFQNILATEGDKSWYFWVDPLLSSKREPVLEVQTGNETSAFILNAPALSGSIRVFADEQQLLTGSYLTLTATESLSIGDIPLKSVDLGLTSGGVTVRAVASNVGPYTIAAGGDLLDFSIDGVDVQIPLTNGNRTASEVAADVRNGLYAAGIPAQNISVGDDGNGSLYIESTSSLEFSSNALSTASPILGFLPGFVPASTSGHIFLTYFENETVLPLTVNGTDYEVPLYKGENDPAQLATQIEAAIPGLTVTSSEGGDYTFDAATGEISLIRTFLPGTRITASYNYPIATRGPFGIDKMHSNNSAIPGTVLAFGRQFKDRDKMAVVVHDSRIPVADEYGGRWDIGLDLDIITRDPMTREEISDFLLLYFFGIRKEALTEEGLELTDISYGGDVEEIYDDTSEEYYFNSSISLTFQTDWAIHVPKPLVIERVTPVSFANEASLAGTDEVVQSDLLEPVTPDDFTLRKIGKTYLKGKSSDFERLL